MLRRFRGRVSRLGVFIDTTIMHGGMEEAMEREEDGRPAHLSDEQLVIVMATQFVYN